MYINLDLKVRETKQRGKKLTAPLEGWDQQMGCAFAIVFGHRVQAFFKSKLMKCDHGGM